MVLSPTARWLLAGLTSIGLQICCCNFKTMLGGCCQGDQDTSSVQVALGEGHDHARHEHGIHGGAHHHGSPAASQEHDQPSKPSAPCDHHDKGGCTCGTHDKAPNLIAKTCLDISPVVVAILSPSTILSPSLTNSAPRYAQLHAVFPPQTSLLQQHCALIV